MNKTILAGLVALGLTATAVCAQTTYTWNGGSGSWHTATNWTPNGLPGADDTAVINAGTVQVTSSITVSNVTINGGTLTHPQGNTNGVQLNVAGTLTVAAGGRIDVTGKGLLGGNAGSTTNYGGYFLGETYLPDNTTIVRYVQGGAAHGSFPSGEPVYSQTFFPQVYGSALDPVLPGSGGGATTSYLPAQGPPPVGGSGGGVVRLIASNMVVDGTISADGGNGFPGAGGGAGGGSGGSIKLQLNGGGFSGSGVISAKSGVPTAGYRVSGAGRVAIVGYASDSFTGTYSLLGSLYRKPAASEGDLQLDHTLLTVATNEILSVGNLSVPATAMTRSTIVNAGTLRITTDHLIVPRLLTLVQDGVIEGPTPFVIGAVTVQSNGVITCSALRTNSLHFNVSGLLKVDAGGSITATGKGLLGGNAGSTTNYGGYFLGETYLPDNATIVRSVQGGAPHGSFFTGGPVYNQSIFPQVYGSAFDPALPGGGGGSTTAYVPSFGPPPVGGSGGGVVRLIAGDMVVDGTISADGGDGFPGGAGGAGGGSGGSIKLQLNGGTLSGSGVISAKSGVPAGYPVSGAGRVAIIGYASDTFAGTLGRAGTIFTQAAGTGGHLLLDGTSLTLAANTTNTLGSLSATTNGTSIIYNHGTLAMADDALMIGPGVSLMQNGVIKGANRPDDRIGSVTVQSNGVISISQGAANGLRLQVAGVLQIDAGGRIDVKGRGLLGGNAGSSTNLGGYWLGEGYLPDNVTVARTIQTGAAHGSLGGAGNQTLYHLLYGSVTDPVLPGSGGGASMNYNPNFGPAPVGGNGGGVVRLAVHDLVVNGVINADGGNPVPGAGTASGGSGGSINVQLSGGSFAGSGAISAATGTSSPGMPASGGGRIAIVGHTNQTFTGTLGRAGMIFTQLKESGGHLQLDGTSLTIATNAISTFSSFSATTNGTSFIYNYGTLAMSDDELVVGPGVSLMQNGVIKGANRPDNWIGSLTVQTNGLIWHSTGNTNGVQLNVAGTLAVELGGRIDVTGRGYLGGSYPGNQFVDRGETRGTNGLPAAGANNYSGGSYGSLGGGDQPNSIYGSETAPVDLGSGGAAVNGYYGGFGGGRMELRVQSLVVNGALRANGTPSYRWATGQTPAELGGGSGGSIYVVLNGGTFSGSGVIEANGGVSLGGRAGGGGRIALVGCFTRNFSGVLTNTGTLYMNACPVLPAQSDRAPDELTLLTVTNTATDDDLTNVLTYALLAAPASATISANGVIQWLSSESDGPSTNLFTTVVSDNAKAPLFTTNYFMVVVNEINLPPALTIPPNANVNELTPFAATATANDPDIPTNPLTFALVSGPAGLTVAPTGEINWIPSEAQGPGTYPVTLSVTDTNPPAINATSLSVTSSFSITVHEVNVAPVLTPPANQTINEAEAFAANATAFDADLPVNALKFELISGPTGLTVSPAGAITWTPNEDQGPGTNLIVLRLSDTNPPAVNATSLSVTSSFELVIREVNVAPVLSLPASTNIHELVTWAANATATDTDNPTNALVFALVSGPAGLSVSPGGGISWTPTEVQGPGTNTVLISVTDTNPIAVNATSLSVTNSFEVVVSEVNTAPVLTLPADTNVNELVAFTAQATATDADAPTNTLTFALVSGPAGLTVSPSGTINWTPTEEQGPGTNAVLIRVTDTNALALTANAISVTNTFAIVVNEVNVAPYLALESVPPNSIINELVPYSFQLAALDFDVPTNQFTYQLISGPPGLTISTNGLVNWTPGETQGPGGYNNISFRVFDYSPQAVNAVSLTNSIGFALSVAEVNLPPVLAPLADHMVNPGQTISFIATATDADLPTNSLSYALVSPPADADITSDGQFTWRAPAALTGTTNTIQVRVQDNGTPVFHGVKSFTVIVNSLGAPVVLTPVTYSGGQFRFQVSGPAGPDYVTEASTNLSDWLRIGTNQSPTLPFEFNDSAAGVLGNRVYRVRLQP